MAEVRRHEAELTAYALETLARIPNLTLYGPRDVSIRGGAISFNYAGLHPHDLGTALDSYGIAVRAGNHCAQPLMRRLGIVATARASFYIYNRRDEIDTLAEGILEAVRFFGNDVPSRS